MMVAPSTAVSPAIRSTTRVSASCHVRPPSPADEARARRPRTSNGGDTAYGIGRTIDSIQASLESGTISRMPPRRCARIDTASWTSTLTESIHDAGESKPSSDVSSGGQSGRLDARSSTIFT
jgi:hypothetical protein